MDNKININRWFHLLDGLSISSHEINRMSVSCNNVIDLLYEKLVDYKVDKIDSVYPYIRMS